MNTQADSLKCCLCGAFFGDMDSFWGDDHLSIHSIEVEDGETEQVSHDSQESQRWTAIEDSSEDSAVNAVEVLSNLQTFWKGIVTSTSNPPTSTNILDLKRNPTGPNCRANIDRAIKNHTRHQKSLDLTWLV